MKNAKLIYKVLSGEANENEKTTVDSWRKEHPSNAEEFEDISRLYQADQGFDAGANERDEKFYEGLHNIQSQIKKIKRKRSVRENAKTFGMALFISAVIFSATLFLIPSSNKSKIPGSDGNISNLLLSDNLVFEDVALRSIIQTLESQYHLTIYTSHKNLLSCRFTGTFCRGISIAEMLRTLAYAVGLELTTKEQGIVELYGEGCQR